MLSYEEGMGLEKMDCVGTWDWERVVRGGGRGELEEGMELQHPGRNQVKLNKSNVKDN